MKSESFLGDIPSHWALESLDKYAYVIDPHPSHRAPAEVADGYPFLGIGDIDYFGNATFDKARHVSLSVIEDHEKNYCISNETIGYAKMGNTIGKIVSFPKRDEKCRYAVSPALSIINPKESINPFYLRSVIESRMFWGQVNGKITGSTRPSIGIQQLRNILIPIPSKKEQDYIGEVWKTLYEKMLLNNRINDNLSLQARALYQAWFVDYEPFGGSAPSDWETTSLGQIAVMKTDSWSPAKNPNDMVEHYSIPAYDEKHYPVFESATDIKSNKYILTSDSVMISKLNPDTKRIWRPMCVSENPVCSTEFIVYEAKRNGQKDYIYSILDSVPFFNYLCAHTTGSTNSRQRATPKATLDFSFQLPPNSIIEDFCQLVTPMYDLIATNIIENQSLAQTRDSLLPRLMSGELDVSGIDL